MGGVPHFSREGPKCDFGFSAHRDLLRAWRRVEFWGNARRVPLDPGSKNETDKR